MRDWKRVQRELDQMLPNEREGSDVRQGLPAVPGSDEDGSILEHIADALRRDEPARS